MCAETVRPSAPGGYGLWKLTTQETLSLTFVLSYPLSCLQFVGGQTSIKSVLWNSPSSENEQTSSFRESPNMTRFTRPLVSQACKSSKDSKETLSDWQPPARGDLTEHLEQPLRPTKVIWKEDCQRVCRLCIEILIFNFFELITMLKVCFCRYSCL